MTRPQTTDCSIEQLIRRESTQLTAGLVRHLGAHSLSLAEDVAQDAMLTALQNWQERQIPDNPGAWLRKVARNRAIDVLRKNNRETGLESGEEQVDTFTEPEFHEIEDAELRLLYLSCHDSLSTTDQVILGLQLAAGFTAGEISKLLLRPRATVAQRLVRLKKVLRQEHCLTDLTADAAESRQDSVLRALYLMFCAGYLATSGETLIRRDITQEALRLAELTARQPNASAEAAALCALLCLQSSRLDAREVDGRLVPLAHQDRSLWNKELIHRAQHHLLNSQDTSRISRYHLEAAIAVEHASAHSFEDTNWSHVARLYQQLEALTGSPVVCVSGALAMLYDGDADGARAQLATISAEPCVQSYPGYFAALAEVRRASGDLSGAESALSEAAQLQQNSVMRAFLDERHLALS